MNRLVDRIRRHRAAARPRHRASAHRRQRVGMILLFLAAFTIAGTSAWAYWTTSGTGTATASTATMSAATGVTVPLTNGTGSVPVSWTASSGTPTPQGYYITRVLTSNSTTAPACGSSPATLITIGLSCTDSSVPDGVFHYTVTAVHNTWTATSGSSGNVTVSVPNKLAFTTSPSASGTSGIALPTQPVITVQNAGGSTVITDTSSLTLALTTPGGATLACTQNPKTAVAGVATFTGCQIDKMGTYTLTATDGSLTSATSTSVTITAGAASRLAFTTQPGSSATSGTSFSPQPRVTVQDAAGNPVTTDTSTVTLSITSSTPTSGGPGTLSGCTQSEALGVVSLAGCRIDLVGLGYKLRAVDGTLTSVDSSAFDVTYGPATQIALTGGASLVSGTSQTLTATIKDAAGNTVTGGTDSTQVVTFAKTTGAGTLTGLGASTASGGVATIPATGVLAGPANLTAAATLTAGARTSNTLVVTVTYGPATQIALTGGASLVSGTSQTLTATIKDAAGNTVTGGTDSTQVVTFAKTSGAGTLTGLGASTASGGVATIPATGGTVGTVNVTATSPLTQGSTTSSALGVTVTYGAATQIVLTGGTSLANGSSQTLTATIQDAAGNTVTSGADATRVVTFAKTTGAGTLTGLGTATAGGGVATKTVTGSAVGAVNVTATAPLTQGSTTSNTLVVTVFGQATQIVLTGGTSLTSGSLQTLTATIEDASGNTVTSGGDSSRVVTFAKASGAGTLTGLGTATAAGGVATKTVTGSIVGPANVTAAATLTVGARTSNTLVVTVTYGPATQIALTGGGSVVSGSPRTLTATIKDAAGNTVTSGTDSTQSVNFSKASGAGSLTGLGNPAAAGGVATLTVTGVTAGAVNVTAAATLTVGATTSNTLVVTVTYGQATQIALTGGAGLGVGASQTLTATIQDAAGNTVTGGTDSTQSVNFTKASGTGTLTGLAARTAAGGLATKNVTGSAVGTVNVIATATLAQGSTTSNALAISVNPAPTITSPTVGSPVNPGQNGSTSFTLTGTNFQNGLTVTGSGSAGVTGFTWLTSTSIRVNVTGSGVLGATGFFRVTNPDGGTVASASGSFKNG